MIMMEMDMVAMLDRKSGDINELKKINGGSGGYGLY